MADGMIQFVQACTA